MSDSADMFKKLAQNRLKSTQAKAETKAESEIKPVPESKSPKKTKAKTKTSAKKTTPEPAPEEKPASSQQAIAPEESTKKRGRPATGKRSDPNWIGRTFYIRKETDFDIEDELIKLKRAGINLDKSELVRFSPCCLGEMAKW